MAYGSYLEGRSFRRVARGSAPEPDDNLWIVTEFRIAGYPRKT